MDTFCDDIILFILSFLDIESLMIFRATSKRINNIILSHFKSNTKIIYNIDYQIFTRKIYNYSNLCNNIYNRYICNDQSINSILNYSRNNYIKCDEIIIPNIYILHPSDIHISFMSTNVLVNKVIFDFKLNIKKYIKKINIKPIDGFYIRYNDFIIPYTNILSEYKIYDLLLEKYLILHHNITVLVLEDFKEQLCNIDLSIFADKHNIKYLSIKNVYSICGRINSLNHIIINKVYKLIDFNDIQLPNLETCVIKKCKISNIHNISAKLTLLHLENIKSIINFTNFNDIDKLTIEYNDMNHYYERVFNGIDFLNCQVYNLQCKVNSLVLKFNFDVEINNEFNNCFKVFINTDKKVKIVNAFKNCYEFVTTNIERILFDEQTKKNIYRIISLL